VLQIGFDELEQYGYAVNAIGNSLDESEPTICISSIPAIYDGAIPVHQFIQAANELAFQQQFFDRQLKNLATSLG
jgi:single-stranded-DNA-specific exonuclease